MMLKNLLKIIRDLVYSGIILVDSSNKNMFFMHRIAAVNCCCLLIMVFNISSAILYICFGCKPLALVNLLSFVLCFMTILLLRKTKKNDLAANIVCMIFTGIVFIGCIQTGSFTSPSIMWLFLLPLGAGFTINFRASFLYGLIAVFVMLMLFKLGQSDFRLCSFSLSANYLKLFYLLQLFTMLVVIVALTYGFLNVYEKALEKLSQSERKFRDISENTEKASRFKSEFLANMSHEIRTPLNGIIGMMHMLIETELTDEQKNYFEVVFNSAYSLLTIINDILDFSKVEAGKLEIDNIEFNLFVALRDMNTMFKMQAEQKGIKYRCKIGQGVPGKLCGDPGRIRQILINFVGNAIKFTSAGEVAVHIRLESEKDEKVVLHFMVVDTGIGISKKKQADIFEPFLQADTSTTRIYGGTGLGLSISRALIHKMNGDFGVESEELLGSTFWFTIHLEKHQKKVGDEIDYLEHIYNKNILVTGGNPSSQDRLKNQLMALGMNASFPCKHNESIIIDLEKALHTGHPYDALIVDMQMGRGNAENIGKLITLDARFKQMPMIVLTSVGEKGDAKLFDQAGYSAYLCKPLDLRLIDDCLKIVLCDKASPDSGKKLIVTRHTIAENQNHSPAILVAEDNETNLIVARALLGRLGYRPDSVRNGKEAVLAFQKKPYDLIIMDCQMPVMDGFEATSKIRQLEEKNKHIPVIAMTANALKGIREKCLEAGMDDYITKPVNLDQLDEIIYRNLYSSDESPHFEPEILLSDQDDDHIFNKEKMLNRFGGSEELVDEIVESFISESPGLIAKLENAVNKKDFDEIKSLSHALKGSSANVNADLLRKAVENFESAANAVDYAEMESIIAKVGREYEIFEGESSR